MQANDPRHPIQSIHPSIEENQSGEFVVASLPANSKIQKAPLFQFISFQFSSVHLSQLCSITFTMFFSPFRLAALLGYLLHNIRGHL
jgi:hypothetical protein